MRRVSRSAIGPITFATATRVACCEMAPTLSPQQRLQSSSPFPLPSGASSHPAAAFRNLQAPLSVHQQSSRHWASMTIVGTAHDIQIGALGDDNVLQFTVVVAVMDPIAASLGRAEKVKAEEKGSGGQKAAGGTLLQARGAGNTNSTAGKPPRPDFLVNTTQDTYSALEEVELAKQNAMAKQRHLYTSKEQYHVRCFGGDEELAHIQTRMMAGDLVSVTGVLRMNKQRDVLATSLSAGRRTAASVSKETGRAHPFIRVDLGNAAGVKALRQTVAAGHATLTQMDESATKSPAALNANAAHAVMNETHRKLLLQANGAGGVAQAATHSYVKSGSVTLISRTKQ